MICALMVVTVKVLYEGVDWFGYSYFLITRHSYTRDGEGGGGELDVGL